MDGIKGYILESGISVPYDYYIGGSHLQRGEKQPNVTACRDKAKVYKTEKSAQNAANRINKYTTDYNFQVIES